MAYLKGILGACGSVCPAPKVIPNNRNIFVQPFILKKNKKSMDLIFANFVENNVNYQNSNQGCR